MVKNTKIDFYDSLQSVVNVSSASTGSLLLRVCIPALLQASDYMAGYFDTDMHMKWRET